jgi:hypothetical protein
LSIARYNITGLASFAEEMATKGLGKPKVSLQFELSQSGITRLVKAEAAIEETVIVQQEVEVKDDEAGENATSVPVAGNDTTSRKAKASEAEKTKASEAEKTKDETKKGSDDKLDPLAKGNTTQTNDTNTHDLNITSNETKTEPKSKKTILVDKVSNCNLHTADFANVRLGRLVTYFYFLMRLDIWYSFTFSCIFNYEGN